MPSPGRQVSGMAGEKVPAVPVGGVGCLVVIPSPDLMAITPRRGRKPGNVSRRSSRKVAAPTRRDRDAIRRRDDHQAAWQ